MLYKKVMLDLRNRIDAGEFGLRENLPTEKKLIEHYGVSRITIRKAVDELVALGLVEKRQGAGTTVIGHTISGSMSSLRSTREYMAEYGVQLEYRVAEFTLIDPSEDIAQKLNISLQDKVYFIRRYKFINGVCAIYEDSYMPMAMFPQMNVMSLQGSKYDYIEQELGMLIEDAEQDFEARMPDPHICEMLDLNPYEPIIRLLSIGRLKDGRVFEYTQMTFKPDNYSFKHYLKR